MKTRSVVVAAATAVVGAVGLVGFAVHLHARVVALEGDLEELRRVQTERVVALEGELEELRRVQTELAAGVRTHVAKRRHGGESGW